MKSFSLTFILSLAYFFLANPAQAQTADEIIDNYYENIGGKDAWRAVKSMKITGEGAQQGMSFPLTVVSKAPNSTKFSVDIQGMKLIEAFDGTNAWTINPFAGITDPTLKSEEEAKEAAKQEFQDALLDYKDKGHTVTLEGTEEYEGTETFKLKLVKKNGDEMIYFFDTELFIPVAMRNYMTTGEMKGRSMDTVSSDYQEVDGLMVPFGMKQKMDGKVVLEMTATEVLINVEIADEEFAFPGS